MRWIALLLLVAASTVRAEELRGRVVSVTDGDTVTVLDADNTQHKIRLQGIDAPERKQAFGTKSKEALSEKIGGKDVAVTWKEKDRYGRIIGEIHIGKRHINQEMVREGWAWHYTQYDKSKTLAEAEREARAQRLGLWADNEPIPPWSFRKLAKAK